MKYIGRGQSKCFGLTIARSLAIAILVALIPAAVPATLNQQKPSPAEILTATTANGKLLLDAIHNYTYYAELTLEVVNDADVIAGKLYRFSKISYDRDGTRQERVFEDKSALPKDVYIGTNAVNNLVRVYSFMITPETINQYEFNYVGQERIDELNTYVFDVMPSVKLPDPQKSRDRYLKGRVWIDDRDFQVVKIEGEALPEQSAHRTPKFETYFQNYAKYWFPAFTKADDIIRVGNRKMRVVVELRFTSYKNADEH